VSELCTEYAKRLKNGHNGQPLIKLAGKVMPLKNGPTPRPDFVIQGWDDAEREIDAEEMAEAVEVQPELPAKKAAADADMDDEIPF
jgi:hypothetical protein